MVKGASGKGTRWRGGERGRGQRTDGRPREARRPWPGLPHFRSCVGSTTPGYVRRSSCGVQRVSNQFSESRDPVLVSIGTQGLVGSVFGTLKESVF